MELIRGKILPYIEMTVKPLSFCIILVLGPFSITLKLKSAIFCLIVYCGNFSDRMFVITKNDLILNSTPENRL